MLFLGEHVTKISSTGQIKLPRKFLSMVYREASRSQAPLILARSPTRNLFEIENPYILEGWRSMEEYEKDKAAYYEEIASFSHDSPMYAFACGKEAIFEAHVSTNGRIKLPELLRDFMGVTGKSENIIISGAGRSFNIQSEKTNDALSAAMQKWLDDKGIHDPLELLPR